MLNLTAAPLDSLFHALADNGRRLMVERLSRGPATVKELAQPLTMSLPAVLQHLRVLEDSGLVRTRKEGRARICEIDAAGLQTVERWIADRRATWERNLDRLEQFLVENSGEPGKGELE